MALVTQARFEKGNWVGLDGPLHKDDAAVLTRAYRQHIDQAPSALTSQSLGKPESYADLLATKDHLTEIRDLKATRDSLGDSDAD